MKPSGCHLMTYSTKHPMAAAGCSSLFLTPHLCCIRCVQLLRDEYITECLRPGSYVEEAIDEIRRANPDYVPVIKLSTAQRAKQRLAALKKKAKREGGGTEEAAPADVDPTPGFLGVSPMHAGGGPNSNGLTPVPPSNIAPSENVVVNMPPGARTPVVSHSDDGGAETKATPPSGLVPASALAPAVRVGSWTAGSDSQPPTVVDVEIVDTHRVGNHIVRVSYRRAAKGCGACDVTLLCSHSARRSLWCRCTRWLLGSRVARTRASQSSVGSVNSTRSDPRCVQTRREPWPSNMFLRRTYTVGCTLLNS